MGFLLSTEQRCLLSHVCLNEPDNIHLCLTPQVTY